MSSSRSAIRQQKLKAGTTVIPIVVINAGDPVGTHLIQSLSRPGGNLTGISDVAGDLAPNFGQLHHEGITDGTNSEAGTIQARRYPIPPRPGAVGSSGASGPASPEIPGPAETNS